MYLYVITGLLLYLAEPPFGLWPLAFVALIPLLHAARRSSNYRRAGIGGLFAGVTFFAPGLFWLTSTTVIGWAALALYCATYVAVFAIFARFTSNSSLSPQAGRCWNSFEALSHSQDSRGFSFRTLSMRSHHSPRSST